MTPDELIDDLAGSFEDGKPGGRAKRILVGGALSGFLGGAVGFAVGGPIGAAAGFIGAAFWGGVKQASEKR